MRLKRLLWQTATTSWALLHLLGATIFVPDDHPEVRLAIAASQPGDEIVVRCGTFEEVQGVEPLSHPLTIRSETGSPGCATIIGLKIQGDANTQLTLQGIEFVGRRFDSQGILLDGGSHFQAADCVFRSYRLVAGSSDIDLMRCEVRDGRRDGTQLAGNRLVLEDCLVSSNQGGYGFVGAVFARVNLEARNTTFTGNDSRYGLSGRILNQATFDACFFGETEGDWLFENGSSADFRNCIMEPGTRFQGGTLKMSQCTLASRFSNSLVSVNASILFGPQTSCLFFRQSLVWETQQCLIDRAESGEGIVADPLFCDVTQSDYSVQGNSPALAPNNPWGLRLGARGAGCGPVSVESTTWSQIKALYR